jgi:hypothetical protein
MSGHWPPEWEDPDDEYPGAGLPDGPPLDLGHSELDLAEVTSFLASVHSPALPASFEERISAAIAAEASARATTSARADATEAAGPAMSATGAEDAKDTDRSGDGVEVSQAAAVGGPATSADRKPRRAARGSRGAAATGPRGTRPDGRRRRLRMPSAQASAWLVVCCLIIAGFGYIFSHASLSSSSSSAESSAAAEPAAAGSAAASEAAGGSSEKRQSSSGTAPEHTDLQPGAGVVFYVNSGTAYQGSTLAAQVKGEVTAAGGVYAGTDGTVTPTASAANQPSATTPVYASASSSAAGTSSPTGYKASAALAGCVAAVTHHAKPTLVDQASYEGTAVYVIAVPTEAWVVGRGCTAADTHIITSVPLKG